MASLEGEVVGEEVMGADRRPQPKARVELVPTKFLEKLIGVKGDMYIGTLDGYDDIKLYLDSKSKNALPRNLGIFGTVGSGKTNTAQVLIEEASRAGWAIIVLDVEGEYTELDRPTTILVELLEAHGFKPKGVKDFVAYHAAAAESEREDAKPFTLLFHKLDPYILAELIDATEAQERWLLPLLEEVKKMKKENAEAKKGTLKGVVGAGSGDAYTLWDVVNSVDTVIQRLGVAGPQKSSLYALKGKLARLGHTGAFDSKGVSELQPEELAKAGRVSVIDVSYTSVRLKNIIIADVLRRLFDHKVEKTTAPPVMIVIEEAHTFVSKENKDRMEATVDMLRDIARRGRKRWISLCFVSQQPSHLPQEIFELSNTHFIHTVKGGRNLDALQTAAGDVEESIWTSVPSMGVGRCFILSPQFKHIIPARIRPAATKRKFTD